MGPIVRNRMKLLTLDYPSAETVACYRIDTERRLRTEVYEGAVTLGDIRSLMAAMVSDPCWSPEFHGLIDFSGAQLDMSANDVLRLALLLKQEENRSRGWLAFVATTSATYGIVRMLGVWSRTSERLQIFQSRQDAEAWLQRNVDRRPPGIADAAAVNPANKLRSAV